MRKKNIIFIMTDDMAPWAAGAGKHPNAVTPHLDSLARDGTSFNKFFTTSPVCSPARCSLLSGLYSTETGVTDFLCSDIHDHLGLGDGTQTWARELQKAGYKTALFGKWHIGEADRFHPTRNGYDVFKGWRGGAGISKNPQMEVGAEIVQTEGYTADIITDEAIRFMNQVDDEPFLVSLHFWEPHCNQGVTTEDGDRTWHPLKKEDWDQFKDLDPWVPNPDYPRLDIPRVKRMSREYLASVHAVDRNVGRVLEAVKKSGLEEDTIIIFTSDNGYNLGHNGIWHKGNGLWILTDNRGDRPNMYDNSLRVPAFIKCPGTVQAGFAVDEPVTTLDWFPTILSFAGIAPDDGLKIRGRDLSGMLCGEAGGLKDGIFLQYQMWDWNQTGADLRAYRTEEWKLAVDFKKTVPNELYHLSVDPDETVNLYGRDEEMHKVETRLFTLMIKEMRQIDDPSLEP
jgi:choline-sulfatase